MKLLFLVLATALWFVTWVGGTHAGLVLVEALAWTGFGLAAVAWYLSVTHEAPPTHRRRKQR